GSAPTTRRARARACRGDGDTTRRPETLLDAHGRLRFVSMISIADSVLSAIGGTPVVRLRRIVSTGDANVLVKLESINPTGSYKDRMALAMIEGAERRGALKPGMRVVEFTGGSTGSSLAMVCAAKGYEFVVLSSDAFAREKLLTMEALGADLRMVPSDDGKVTPALFERFRKEIAVLA